MVTGKLDGLQFAYYFSYVKLAITMMKYFPQVNKDFSIFIDIYIYMNYKGLYEL
jgi:hypothetical protein